MKSLLFAIAVAILASASTLLAIELVGWKPFVDRFAGFASWPGDKADGGLVQLLILVAITVTLLGLIFVYWQMRGAEASRRVQVMLQLSQQWDSAFLRVSRHKIQQVASNLSLLLALVRPSLNRDYYYWVGVSSFFEDLGIAVKKGWISLADAEDKFGPSIDRYYPMYSEYVDINSDERILEWFRWLYERKRSSKWASLTQQYSDSWRGFWALSWRWKGPIVGVTVSIVAYIVLTVGITVASGGGDNDVDGQELTPTATTVTPTSIPSPTVIPTEIEPTPEPTPEATPEPTTTPSPTPEPTPSPEPTQPPKGGLE